MKPYYKTDLTTIYNGDCLEIMDYLIEQGIKFDAIITDPPYGTTACSWDSIIPFDEMWARLNKLRKEKTPVVLFGSEPFSSKLRMSNLKEFKYDWIWDKIQGKQPMLAKIQPMKSHEIASIFYNNNYYPQMWLGKKYTDKRGGQKLKDNEHYKTFTKQTYIEKEERYPTSVIQFNNPNFKGMHPTQKPVELLSYLIKTYTKPNDLILDFTAGSFTTCVASEQLNRRSIGIELEKKYCDIGVKRLSNLQLRFDI